MQVHVDWLVVVSGFEPSLCHLALCFPGNEEERSLRIRMGLRETLLRRTAG